MDDAGFHWIILKAGYLICKDAFGGSSGIENIQSPCPSDNFFVHTSKPMDCGPWGSFFVNYKVKNPYLFAFGKSGKARVDGTDGVKSAAACDVESFFIRTAKGTVRDFICGDR